MWRNIRYGLCRGLVLRAAAAVAGCLAMLCSCHGTAPAEGKPDGIEKKIEDKVYAGDLAAADSLLAAGLAEAKDSDAYYRLLAVGLSIDYYGARLEGLDEKVGRIEAFTSSRKPSQARSLMMYKAMQAKGASFTQFRFNSDSSIYYMEKAIGFARNLDDRKNLLLAYSNTADALKNMGLFDRSMDYYMQAVSLADSIDVADDMRMTLYMGLAANYTGLRDFDNSAVWWDRTKKYWDVMGFIEKFNYLNNRGNDWFYQKKYKEALSLFLELDAFLGDSRQYDWERHFCRANLSDIYLKLGMPDKAGEYIDENLRYFTETQPNEYAATHVRTQKIEWLMQTGHLDEAARMLAVHDPGPATRPEQLSLRLELEKNLYPKLGEWRKAFEAQSEYQALEDSLRNASVRMNIEAMRHRYEHDAQVKELRMEGAERERQLTYSYVIIALAAILIALAVAVAVMSRRMARDREERMYRKIVDLRMQNFRSRLTPHFIFNILNTNIPRDGGEGKNNVSRLVHLLRQQQEMADRLTDTLSEELEFVDNFVALRSGMTAARVSYEKFISPDVDPDEVVIPSMTVQIFVENAFKHGFTTLPDDAERILRINVYRTEGAIRIEVCNNAGEGVRTEGQSSRQDLRIVAGTIQIVNEKNQRHISFSLTDWTDNPQHSGKMAWLTVPDGFSYPEMKHRQENG